MKDLLKISSFLVLLYFSTGLEKANAQNSKLRYADKQYDLENYAHAAEMYEMAFQEKASYSTAVKLAESYSNMWDYLNAYEWWAKVIEFEEAGRDDYYQYLLAAMQAGKGMDAEELLQNSDFEVFDFPEIDFLRLKQLYSRRENVKLVPVTSINSPVSDFGTSTDYKGNVYFTSDRGPVTLSKKPFVRLDAKNKVFSKGKSDLNDRGFFSTYKKDPQGNISKLQVDLPKALHISDPSVTNDGKLIFFTAVIGREKGRERENIENHPEIYFGEIQDNGEVNNIRSFPLNNPLVYGVMHPFVDESKNRIYFSSDVPGGNGGYDLYYVTYDTDMNFGDPVNMGPQVNTSGNESHPFRHNEIFYFSSSGHPGLGGMDIFKGKYSDGEVTEIKNMGVPYNSPRDDFAYFVNHRGKRFLSSDREGGQGLDDVYEIETLQQKKPQMEN